MVNLGINFNGTYRMCTDGLYIEVPNEGKYTKEYTHGIH